MSSPDQFLIFSTVGGLILDEFNSFALDESLIIASVTPILAAALTINIMWHGYQLMRGKGGGNVWLDVFAKSVRVGLVCGLGLSLYDFNIAPIISEFIGWLSQSSLFNQTTVVNGFGSDASAWGAGTNIMTTLQQIDSDCNLILVAVGNVYDAATASGAYADNAVSLYSSGTNGTNPNPAGMMMVYQAIGAFFAFVSFAAMASFDLVFINIALIFVYALGPIFIAAYAFRATEQFFGSWLKAVVQYVLTAVVLGFTLQIALGIMGDMATSINTLLPQTGDTTTPTSGADYLELGVASVAICGMLGLFIRRVPELAGQILGGFSLGSSAPEVDSAAQRGSGDMHGREGRQNTASRYQQSQMTPGSSTSGTSGAGSSTSGASTPSAPSRNAQQMAGSISANTAGAGETPAPSVRPAGSSMPSLMQNQQSAPQTNPWSAAPQQNQLQYLLQNQANLESASGSGPNQEIA